MNRRQFLAVGAQSLILADGLARGASDSGLTRTASDASPSSGAGGLLSGSFLVVVHPNVWDMAYCDESLFWREQNWQALIRDMYAIGIDTAIWANCAFWGRPLFPADEKHVGRPLRMGCEDPLGVCADEADRLGMKVYYGVGLRGRVSQVRDYAGMEKPWDDVWFTWNTALAEAILKRYGAHRSFGGLYIPYEMDFIDHEIELYERLIRKHLRPVVGKAKILVSPGNLAGPTRDRSSFLKKVERAGFDILAPQDYGGRDQNSEKALGMVREHAQALAQVARPLRDLGVTLWSNCETFVLGGTPDGRSVCLPGPISRIEQQIEMQSPLVEKLITWIYQGVMNHRSDLVNVGHPSTEQLYRGYLAYLAKKFPTRFRT